MTRSKTSSTATDDGNAKRKFREFDH